MKVFLVELEPVETRYTAQWKKYLPEQMQFADLEVHVIEGPSDAPTDTTPGAFLNFSGTNYWKSEQLKTISKLIADGKVSDGDYFLYTDAWNPTVIQLKYMAELLDIDIKIGGMWHAGSYDPADFLGRLIGDAPWVRHAERSMFEVFDDNFFATDFHLDMFCREFGYEKFELMNTGKAHIVGWPMEYLQHELAEHDNAFKENIILFPHRLAPEKQVDIFKDLAESMPEYDWIVCQEQTLTKEEYHELLGRAKIVFSANTQETLGISCYEGALVGANPMVPDRLSYSEMYQSEFLYPSDWTEDFDSYILNKDLIMAHIKKVLGENDKSLIDLQAHSLTENFFSGKALYEVIRGRANGN
jgi:hypothetical protein|tara:strand:- start:12426 stop:13496 length:1071 start_codon:yes stop_codon:yes gene_type:complete